MVEAGWAVIAARHTNHACERFQAAGAHIAVIDLRGADEGGIALIHEIAKLEMTQPIIILAVGASRQLQRAVSAGATYILPIPFRLNMLILALRAAEAYVLRSIDTWGNSLTSSNLWRDDQLVWDFDGDFVSISPALAELLRTNPNPTMIERFLDAFAPDVRHQIN
ncbi:MAG: hypothetical protein KGJ05_08745, partial [Alphaproteobacteria bacterium]|nr:hypothetical protein [Alphaproteobacteria bacterium]